MVRNHRVCVQDGGRGVCSSDVHQLVQKPVSVAQKQFALTTRSLELAMMTRPLKTRTILGTVIHTDKSVYN